MRTDRPQPADAPPPRADASSPAADDLLLALRRCPGCGYRMAGLPEAKVCPECGGRVSREELLLCGFACGRKASLWNAGPLALPKLLILQVVLLAVPVLPLVLLKEAGDGLEWIWAGHATIAAGMFAVRLISADPSGTVLARLTSGGYSQVDRPPLRPGLLRAMLAVPFFSPGIAAAALAWAGPRHVVEYFAVLLAGLQALLVFVYLARRGTGRQADAKLPPAEQAARKQRPWTDAAAAGATAIDADRARLTIDPRRSGGTAAAAAAAAVDVEFPCTAEERERLRELIHLWQGGDASSEPPVA